MSLDLMPFDLMSLDLMPFDFMCFDLISLDLISLLLCRWSYAFVLMLLRLFDLNAYHTLISAFTPSNASFSFKIGSTTFFKNAST